MGLSPPIDGNEPTDFSFSSAYPSPLPTSPSSPTPLPSSSWRAPAQTARVLLSEAVNAPPVPQLQSPQPRSSLRPIGGKPTEVAQLERGLPPSDTQAGPDTESTKTSAVENVGPSTSGVSSQGTGPSSLGLGQRGNSASVATSPPGGTTESTPTEQDHTPRPGDSHGPKDVQGGFSESRAEPPAAMKAPASRKKVPFEKGFSQMDWLRLTQTHPDLAGLRGGPRRRIKMEEVKLHKAEDDSWTVLRGKVFNITPYFNFHPGGKKMLKLAAGKDSTELFNKYHMWVNADYLLEKCWLGIIDND